jgi:hypothetical protein
MPKDDCVVSACPSAQTVSPAHPVRKCTACCHANESRGELRMPDGGRSLAKRPLSSWERGRSALKAKADVMSQRDVNNWEGTLVSDIPDCKCL